MIKASVFFFFFNLVFVSVVAQSPLSCETYSSSAYFCDENKSQEKCRTYAILRANSFYSSLSNLSSYLGISRSQLMEANNLSAETEFFSLEQLVLIPIECGCSTSGFYEAAVQKTTIKGESFYEISESLEGLTTCNSIKAKNPRFSPWNLEERINLSVPLKCACPPLVDSTKFLLSYPVREGDTLAELALKFNVSQESISLANSIYSRSYNNSLVPLSTLLIPSQSKPFLDKILAKSHEPDLGYPSTSLRVKNSHKKTIRKKRMIPVYIAIGVIAILAIIAIGATFFFIHFKKQRKESSIKNRDMELQQLSLSVRTTSDKKVSFDGSHYNFDDPKTPLENYKFEELQKATEDFNSSNLIEGSVFHGRHKGKNLAIKRVASTTLSKIDFHLFDKRVHHHPNIIRLLGTCLKEGPDSYIVFEYAENGSLKDWIHGGLAIKSHFISTCNCFLTWNQRVKICLDIATSLQYMHHILNPSYVHGNIKSRNIFLDEDFSAKVGNFGMPKSSSPETEDQESCPNTSWDKGYLAPEYQNKGEISPNLDIFAYGVVLLEVLTGKPPLIKDEERENGGFVKLSEEIKRVLETENAEELRGWIDGGLGENYSFDGAVNLANLARSCVEEDPCSRPNAGEIVEKLLRLVDEEGDEFDVCESSCKPLVKVDGEER